MGKQIGIGYKLSLYTGGAVFVGFVVLIFIVLSQISASSQGQAKKIAALNSDYYGYQVEAKFNSIRVIGQEISNHLEAMCSEGEVSREVAILTMKNTLKTNSNIFGVTIVYEPNMLDGNDSTYAGKEGHSKMGQFMPYVTRVDNDFSVDIGIYDNYTEDQMKWYNVPRDTGKPFLTEPTTYEVQGKDVTMASVVVPIIRNNKFIGVVSIDTELNYLQDEIEKVKPMGGYTELISAEGVYVANGTDPKSVMLNVTKLEEWKKIIEKTSKGEKFSEIGAFGSTMKNLRVFSPIHVEGSAQYWSFVSVIPMKSILAEYNFMFELLIIIGLIMIIVIVTVQFFLIKRTISPIKAISKLLSLMSDSDFTGEVPLKFFKAKDEIGDLSRAIRTMQQAMKNIINGVITEAKIVEMSNRNVQSHITILNSDIEDVSATTEELSAGMEQTAASTQEMNATSSEIEQAAESIAKKAEEGAGAAFEISKRAEQVKEKSLLSQNIANTIRSDVDLKLRNAIEQSKAIEQISLLSNSILQITSQTNLLALNAAIEAARAGEAGKGFAVVADEIRKLAEDSKNTVNEIQGVTKQVVSSVENLAESSHQVLDFIEQQVIADYSTMVATGEQYYKDAEYVNEIVTDFSATAEELAASIQNMIKAINEVSITNNEAAVGTQNIAQKTSEVSEKANDVVKLASSTMQSSEKLIRLVNTFKV